MSAEKTGVRFEEKIFKNNPKRKLSIIEFINISEKLNLSINHT